MSVGALAKVRELSVGKHQDAQRFYLSGVGAAREARDRVLGAQILSSLSYQVVGSAFPGFHVVSADAPRELELAGCHRFSNHALIFRFDEPVNGRVRLRAETRAEFPGVLGKIYRAMVIGTGGHVLAVKRLLASAKRQAERA